MAKARKPGSSAMAGCHSLLQPRGDAPGEASVNLCGADGRPDDRCAGPSQRLDKWLVYARFAKTRTMACRLIDDGFVRINGAKVTHASRAIGVQDVLTLALPQATLLVRVVGVADRRGSFAQARALYEVLA